MQNSSYKPKRKQEKRGLWIEEYAIDSTQYKSVGKYKNGDPTKKWHYYTNGRIIKKEKYKKTNVKRQIIMKMEKFNQKEKPKLVVQYRNPLVL